MNFASFAFKTPSIWKPNITNDAVSKWFPNNITLELYNVSSRQNLELRFRDGGVVAEWMMEIAPI